MLDPRLFDAILSRDLGTFIAQCFGTLEPGTPYLDNWHIHAMAYQLTRVWRGECKRLIINVPPRSAKSICVTIAYTAWVMGHDPRKRIMAISYANELSLTHAAGFRSVVTSDWYRRLFPALAISANRSRELQTTQKGYRFASSIGGSVLGRGADLIVIDDATARNPCRDPLALVITKRQLARQGSAAIFFDPEAASSQPSVAFSVSQPYRPWHEQRQFSREARGLPPASKPERPRTAKPAISNGESGQQADPAP